ncbi:MAG: hypothetical protein AB7S26_14105 [Sandaracinaceae bacterium]
MTIRLILLATLMALIPRVASAQDEATRARARALVAEAHAHEDAQRWELAAQSYQRLYDLMSQARLPRASVALWTAGSDLARVPGREREASDELRRFLAQSGALAGDPEIAGYRAQAPQLIAQLEARAASSGATSSASSQDTSRGGGTTTSVSPVGPVVLAVGGAAVIAGVIVGIVSLDMASQLDADCTNGVCPDTASVQSRLSVLSTLSVVADVLWISGAAIAAAGLVLTLVLTDTSETAVSAGCVGTGCMAEIRGTF